MDQTKIGKNDLSKNDTVYVYLLKLDASKITGLMTDTVLRNMVLVFADVNSDYAGRMFLDNVKFEKEAPAAGTGTGSGNDTSTGSTTLPQTGTFVGMNDMFILGTVLLLAGVVLTRRKNRAQR